MVAAPNITQAWRDASDEGSKSKQQMKMEERPAYEVEELGVDWEVERRDHDREDERVEQRRREVERTAESAEVEVRRPKVVRCHRQAEEPNQAICGDGRDAACGDKRGEGDLTWEDGAEEDGAKDEHDCDGVSRLAVCCDLANPA